MKLRSRNFRKFCFTLTEVAAVAAIVVSIPTSTYTRGKRKAYETQCRNNLQQIGQLLTMYVLENGHYPNAALFGFTIALIAYNTVSLAKSAIRKVHGDEYVDETLSSYYLTHEMSQVIGGLLIATEPSDWRSFRTASQEELAITLVALAENLATNKYRKHKRGPKKKRPRLKKDNRPHVSTAREIGLV